MLVPMSWLREFVPYEGATETLGAKLTMLGLELEGINHPFADLVQIRVGYVAQCSDHPDSDHLRCCKVDLGDGELLDIVCGAPNVAAGQKVAVAPVGARLPDGTVIKKARLRGQPSFGMICSERELGLSDDHSGILVLPESCDVGHNLLDALDMERDVLDLSITPNRADCLSIYGIARETAMAFGLPLHMAEIPLIPDERSPEIIVPVTVDSPELCWLYSGRVLSGVKIEKSPMRMRHRLISVNVRPINNIVDITNYILMECGQPLHAFDLDKLDGREIIVRKARENEHLVTLDGKDRKLSTDDLCICDAKRPVGLAGVMGGENTEIGPETKNVFLESAVFAPGIIRKTAKRLGLHSEASFRFERGIDQRATISSLDRACAMMASIAGAFARKGFSCVETRPFIPKKISFVPQKCRKLLGCEIPDEFQKNALEKDGCPVHEFAQAWEVTQPSWRPDLTREADLFEEVARIYGVDEIPCKLPEVARNGGDNPSRISSYDFFRRIRHWAADLGLLEAVNYSFTSSASLEMLKCLSDENIRLVYPLSEDMNVLRTNLLPGLLTDLANNLAHGAHSIRIFELANVFSADGKSETGAIETPLLGLMLSGTRHEKGWPRSSDLFDYGDVKGICANLFKFLHLPEAEYALTGACPWLEPCVGVAINKKAVGYIGRLKPEMAKAWNAQKPVWLAELALPVLHSLNEKAVVSFQALPVYPQVWRDMTVMAKEDMEVGVILDKIFMLKMPMLEGAELVDCFLPENERERYLTFRLTYRHPDRTLKDQEVDREREKLAQILRKELGVRI